MGTLVLLRHAKADRPNGVADIDRPLTERGHADSAAAGAWLLKNGYVPGLVLCSPAKRTRQTWHSVAVAVASSGAPHVRYERAIYDGNAEELLKLVQSITEDVETVVLIGHNPSISYLSELLDAESEADSDGLRTGGLVVHQTDSPWSSFTHAPRVATHTARAAA